MNSKYVLCNFKMVPIFMLKTCLLALRCCTTAPTPGPSLLPDMISDGDCGCKVGVTSLEHCWNTGSGWKWLEKNKKPKGPGPKTERTLPRLTWLYLKTIEDN